MKNEKTVGVKATRKGCCDPKCKRILRSKIKAAQLADELKMNNSEKIYCISICSIGTVELTESEYEKYLGDVNTVSVTEYGIDAICYGAFGKSFIVMGVGFLFLGRKAQCLF